MERTDSLRNPSKNKIVKKNREAEEEIGNDNWVVYQKGTEQEKEKGKRFDSKRELRGEEESC